MKKTCPKCKRKSVKLYRNQTIEGKRKWIPLMWYCTSCSYIYQNAADTLLYKSGELYDFDEQKPSCVKCDKRLTRLYQHKNPKYGKQQWLSIGWYCDRCRYAWVESSVKQLNDGES